MENGQWRMENGEIKLDGRWEKLGVGEGAFFFGIKKKHLTSNI